MVQKLARSDIAIANCGALSFEESEFSECPGRREFQKHMNDNGSNSIQYSLNYYKTNAKFKEELANHFPFLTQGRQTIMINCNHLRNPESQETVKFHLGLHPTTLKQTAAHWELECLLQDIKQSRTIQKQSG